MRYLLKVWENVQIQFHLGGRMERGSRSWLAFIILSNNIAETMPIYVISIPMFSFCSTSPHQELFCISAHRAGSFLIFDLDVSQSNERTKREH